MQEIETKVRFSYPSPQFSQQSQTHETQPNHNKMKNYKIERKKQNLKLTAISFYTKLENPEIEKQNFFPQNKEK